MTQPTGTVLESLRFLWANGPAHRPLRAFAGRRQVVLIFERQAIVADLLRDFSLFSPMQQRPTPPQCRGALLDIFTSLPPDWLSWPGPSSAHSSGPFELSG